MKDRQINYSNIDRRSVHDDRLQDEHYQKYRNSWWENPKHGVVADFPLNVDLEVTNACNLKCPHCARTHKNWGAETVGYIDEEIANKVIDEIDREGGYSMKFSLRGEPLLHSRLLNFLEKAKKSSLIDFYFNTNGTLMDEGFARRLVDLAIPRVSISVGGWDEDSFSRCQMGADFKNVYNNVKYLITYRNKSSSHFPKIRIQAVRREEILVNIDKLKKIWQPLSDEIGLIDFREETGERSYMGTISPDFRCNFLWQRLVVLWDGSVYPCLFHGVKDNSSLYLGNVKKTSLKDLWHGDCFNDLRKLHRTGRSHLNSGCEHCSYRFTVMENMF